MSDDTIEGRATQALQDIAQALPVLLDVVPTLMERAGDAQAEARALRRMLWVRHGCPIKAQRPDARTGSLRCLSCDADFGLDAVAELRDKLAQQQPPAEALQAVQILDDEEGAAAVPMNADWRPGTPEDWADVEAADPQASTQHR